MRKIETTVTYRDVYYVEYDDSVNWETTFPTGQWCLTIVADEPNLHIEEIIKTAIDNDTGYICGIGKQQEFIHLTADLEISRRHVEGLHLPEHHIVTVGEEDFENGLWFSLYLTFNGETDINTIVIVNFLKKSFSKFSDLIQKFEKGYLPPDN